MRVENKKYYRNDSFDYTVMVLEKDKESVKVKVKKN